jgi:hypothetical protein
MTTENDPQTASQKPWEKHRNHSENYDYFAWAKTPGINPMKVATVVAGFAIFPPLGAAALIYFLWKNRRMGWQDEQFAYAGAPVEGEQRHGCGRGWRGHHRRGHHMGGRGRWTGNAAFDQHQADAIEKLRADRQAFWAFREEERRKRDQDAYDAFRARHNSAGDNAGTSSETP